jgi:hypothetical protein
MDYRSPALNPPACRLEGQKYLPPWPVGQK